MRVIKYQDLREFMLGLDHREYTDALKIVVKYYSQYVYTACIIYDPYGQCWRCLSNQTTGGSVHATWYDPRTVRAYVEREAKVYQNFALGDIPYTDEACMPAEPSISWTTTINSNTTMDTSADSNGSSPFNTQVISWLAGAS